ncbi:MAG: hypothetical protein R2780_09140 [Crocinitomicaceae bacterium]|nr:hypothetical protein [Crocinitomicaceae bacterium]
MILLKIIGVLALIIIVIIGLLEIGRRNRIASFHKEFNTKGFTQLEVILFEELYDLFDENIQVKLQSQISYFENKRKWRHYWDKSMTMELYGDNDNPLSDNQKYPRKDERKLATIRFKANGEKFSVEYSNYDGRIWGWKIRPNPKNIQTVESIEVTSKKINHDPNEEVQIMLDLKEFKSIPKFTGFLAEVIEIKKPNRAFKPLLREQIEFFEEKVEGTLPKGYYDLIEQTEGVEFDEFSIGGISRIRATSLDDGNYYHLAEFSDGVLALKEGSSELFFCGYSGLIDPLGTDFGKALKQCVENAC